jgi:Rps23 Pro-64 3,4-dihydroxylase Tpa1-like proline 4-hydroxylase
MRVINNFTSPDFIAEILKENQDLMYENVWRSNLGWQNDIVSPNGVVLIRPLNDNQKKELLQSLKIHDLVPTDKQIELDAQAYMWHNLSFIPWHSDKENDDEVRYAATLYLNKEWNNNWGGLFLYKKNDNIYAEAPRFNLLVFNDQNYEHATSMLTSNAPFRYTIQLFWKIIK